MGLYGVALGGAVDGVRAGVAIGEKLRDGYNATEANNRANAAEGRAATNFDQAQQERSEARSAIAAQADMIASEPVAAGLAAPGAGPSPATPAPGLAAPAPTAGGSAPAPATQATAVPSQAAPVAPAAPVGGSSYAQQAAKISVPQAGYDLRAAREYYKRVKTPAAKKVYGEALTAASDAAANQLKLIQSMSDLDTAAVARASTQESTRGKAIQNRLDDKYGDQERQAEIDAKKANAKSVEYSNLSKRLGVQMEAANVIVEAAAAEASFINEAEPLGAEANKNATESAAFQMERGYSALQDGATLKTQYLPNEGLRIVRTTKDGDVIEDRVLKSKSDITKRIAAYKMATGNRETMADMMVGAELTQYAGKIAKLSAELQETKAEDLVAAQQLQEFVLDKEPKTKLEIDAAMEMGQFLAMRNPAEFLVEKKVTVPDPANGDGATKEVTITQNRLVEALRIAHPSTVYIDPKSKTPIDGDQAIRDAAWNAAAEMVPPKSKKVEPIQIDQALAKLRLNVEDMPLPARAKENLMRWGKEYLNELVKVRQQAIHSPAVETPPKRPAAEIFKSRTQALQAKAQEPR